MQPECREIIQKAAPHMSPVGCPELYTLNEPFPGSLQLAALKLVLRGCMHSFHRPTRNFPLCVWLQKGTAGGDGASVHIVH